GGVGVAQRGGGGGFGGEGAGVAGALLQQVEALVGVVGEDDAPAGEGLVVAAGDGQVGAAAVFVDAGAGVPGGGQQVGDGAVGGAVHDGGAAVLVGPGLLPPGLVADDGGEAQAGGAVGDVGRGDGRGPAAVGQDHAFVHGALSRAVSGAVGIKDDLSRWWGGMGEPRRPWWGGRGSRGRAAGSGGLSGCSRVAGGDVSGGQDRGVGGSGGGVAPVASAAGVAPFQPDGQAAQGEVDGDVDDGADDRGGDDVAVAGADEGEAAEQLGEGD